MEMNGIAHVQLTVNDLAVSRAFYARLFAFLEMQVVFDSPQVFYGVGSRTAVAISPCEPAFSHERFEQRRVGLHHLCFRARRREHVDELYEFLKTTDARIVHPPEEGRWAPGYYSVLFEDPDGIRLEANYIPGKGNLADGVELPLDVERLARGSREGASD